MSSVQETLRSQRERLGQSRVAAAAAARLPEHVPGALESGELPLDDATTLAYVRIYARHLGLDAEDLLRGCQVDVPADHDWDAPTGRRPATTWQRLLARRGPLVLMLGVLGLLFLGLAATLVWGGARGPADVQLVAPSSPGPDLDGGDGAVDARDAADDDAADDDAADDDAAGDDAAGDRVTGDEAAGDAGDDAAGDAGDAAGDGAAEDEAAGDEAAGNDAAGEAPSDGAAVPDTAAALPGRAPQETRVQILHHAADQAAADEVRAVLEALGYQVPHVNRLGFRLDQTTVQAVTGWMVEAESLRARDGRFGQVEPNRVFSTEVHLHVVVGADWSGQV